MRSKRCGNCTFFVRIKDWGGTRNGLCDKFDYNVHADSTYAKTCKGYAALQYKRQKTNLVTVYCKNNYSKGDV
jgi:hypothetical protein